MITNKELLEVECFEDKEHTKKRYDATLLAISKDYAYVVPLEGKKSTNEVVKIYTDRIMTKF